MRKKIQMKNSGTQRGSCAALFGQMFWIFVFSGLWWLNIHSRNFWLSPECAHHPDRCEAEKVFKLDQLSLGLEDERADEWSDYIQKFSGLFAIVLPMFWRGSEFFFSRRSASELALLYLKDLFIVLQMMTLNGLLTEISHIASNRARPFVYLNPQTRGLDPAHYTSFYSGHTSFTAVTMSSAVLFLKAHKAHPALQSVVWILAQGLIFSVAYFRIFAGRHFYTDVLVGAFAGVLMAHLVFYFYRRLKKNKGFISA